MEIAIATGVVYLVAIIAYIMHLERKIHKDKPKFKN
jgi:Na+-driven multidrug efflux pump